VIGEPRSGLTRLLSLGTYSEPLDELRQRVEAGRVMVPELELDDAFEREVTEPWPQRAVAVGSEVGVDESATGWLVPSSAGVTSHAQDTVLGAHGSAESCAGGRGLLPCRPRGPCSASSPRGSKIAWS
jgi:hypothetical protein